MVPFTERPGETKTAVVLIFTGPEIGNTIIKTLTMIKNWVFTKRKILESVFRRFSFSSELRKSATLFQIRAQNEHRSRKKEKKPTESTDQNAINI